MELPKSCQALEDARRSLEDLQETLLDAPDKFRHRFVACLALLRSVGSVLDSEVKGHRTPAFEAWWKQTAEDPLHRFLTDARNMTLKQRIDRHLEKHQVTLHEAAHVSLSMEIAIYDGKTGELLEVKHDEPEPPTPVALPEPTHEISVAFSGGNSPYDSQPVLPLLHRYFEWLRDVVVPTAESLSS